VIFNLIVLSLNSNFTTYEGTINLEDNEKMFYIVHVPKGEGTKPFAIFMHGFSGNSEMMDVIASELTNNGILTVSYDNRGHGKSGSRLSNVTYAYDDFLKIVDIGAKFGAKTNSIALIGHSMGASYAQTLTKNDS